ncbi:MAG TPA: acyl carrier protein [Polyangiaceae bacterium]|nr:acyl carrier protein [Polyangiaceae bacterium]
MNIGEMTDEIRQILRQHGKIADVDSLKDDADLYAAGLTSHATVNLMVALEDHFGVEFPERMLRRRSFESITAISAALAELKGGL